MTTGAPLDARRATMPSYILMRDGICSQHGGPPQAWRTTAGSVPMGPDTRRMHRDLLADAAA